MCLGNCETRLDREDYCIETLEISYPHGPNERIRKAEPNLPLDVHFLLFEG